MKFEHIALLSLSFLLHDHRLMTLSLRDFPDDPSGAYSQELISHKHLIMVLIFKKNMCLMSRQPGIVCMFVG